MSLADNKSIHYQIISLTQGQSQSAEIVLHIQGRVINYVSFQMGTSLKGKNLLPEWVNSFLKEMSPFSLMVWKFPYEVIFLQCVSIFIMHVCNCIMEVTRIKLTGIKTERVTAFLLDT